MQFIVPLLFSEFYAFGVYLPAPFSLLMSGKAEEGEQVLGFNTSSCRTVPASVFLPL